MNTRIELTDTGIDVILKLSEGNPGAVTVCMEVLKKGTEIDPDAFGGGLMQLLGFDTLGLYGSRIWMLYKDVCECDLVSTLGVMRAWQLGFITQSQLNWAIDNRGDGLDVEQVVNQVKERLPSFGHIAEPDVEV